MSSSMQLQNQHIGCQLIVGILFLGTIMANLKDIEEIKILAEGNSIFSLDLLNIFGEKNKDGNLFLSPFSISTALALTHLGSSENTQEEMRTVLRWTSLQAPLEGFGSYLSMLQEAKSEEEKGYVLAAAQRVYVSNKLTLKEEFNVAAKKYFGADAQVVNFSNPEAERQSINSWIASKTHGKIHELLASGILTPLTVLVLVQATYFKGRWLYQFDSRRTTIAAFIAPQGQVMVKMMVQSRNFNYSHSQELGCAAIELPYAKSATASEGTHDLSMLILLPDALDGIKQLEAKLTLSDLVHLRNSMRSIKVDLQLPRFVMESSLQLKEALINLGMKDAFDENAANFSGLVEEKEFVYISDVIHKAIVEVNEEGSEAAAATAVVMMKRSISITTRFIANHPFLFFIIDKRADIILFLGHLVNPQPVSADKEEL